MGSMIGNGQADANNLLIDVTVTEKPILIQSPTAHQTGPVGAVPRVQYSDGGLTDWLTDSVDC